MAHPVSSPFGTEAVASLLRRVAERAASDEAYRTGVVDAAALLTALVEAPPRASEPVAKTNHNEAAAEPKPRPAPSQPYQPKVSDAYLRDVAQRCRLKRRIALWIAGLPEGFLDDEALDCRDAYESEARALPHCSPWMLPSDGGREGAPGVYEQLALAYEAAALAAEAFRRVDRSLLSGQAETAPPAPERTTVFSGATVQSALRVAAQAVRAGYDEPEQRALFRWLRGYTAWRQVYISRHMRLDDPASPEDLADVVEALRDLIEANPSLTDRGPDRERMLPESASGGPRERDLSALRYHAEHAAEDGFMADHHWERLRGIARTLLADGTAYDTDALRHALAPLAQHVPATEAPTEALHHILAHDAH